MGPNLHAAATRLESSVLVLVVEDRNSLAVMTGEAVPRVCCCAGTGSGKRRRRGGGGGGRATVDRDHQVKRQHSQRS
jgi:hypothetical protein